MSRRTPAEDVLAQVLSCLDAAASRPGLVGASVAQTEGYLRGLQGLAWETPVAMNPAPEDVAGTFLHDVRSGKVPLRGRLKKEAGASAKAFLQGFCETFSEAKEKPFPRALARLAARWSAGRDVSDIGRLTGRILRREYEEGVAGELSPYLLDDRLHLRNVRDYLRMRGWLQGTIEHLRRKADWESREAAEILAGNFASIVLRALHNADVDYAAKAAAAVPRMADRLDRAAKRLAATEPEAAHFLRKNRATVLTRALHSGYLDYPAQAAGELPRVLKDLNEKIAGLETASPEKARNLRAALPASVYRALTNGKFD